MHCLAIFCTVIKFNVSPCTGLVHLSPKTAVRSNLSTFCFHELIHKDLDLAPRANIFINHPKMLHISKQRKSFSFKRKPSQKPKTDEFGEKFQKAFELLIISEQHGILPFLHAAKYRQFGPKMPPQNFSENPSVI